MIESLYPKFLENALSEPAKEVGHALGNLFYAAFYPINYWPEKLRMHHQVNMEKYKESISREITKIPSEKLTPPPIDIVGPAFEASKYHIECAEIRDMFAKLIASSMNIDTQAYAHHSFVEIIKQLSPLDSCHIKFLSNGHYHKIVQYRGNIDCDGFRIFQDHVFLANPLKQDILLNSISIANLERLGIVSISYDTFAKSSYDVFESTSLFHSYTDVINQLKNSNTLITNKTGLDLNWFESISSVSIQKGIIGLTPLGKSLASICC